MNNEKLSGSSKSSPSPSAPVKRYHPSRCLPAKGELNGVYEHLDGAYVKYLDYLAQVDKNKKLAAELKMADERIRDLEIYVRAEYERAERHRHYLVKASRRNEALEAELTNRIDRNNATLVLLETANARIDGCIAHLEKISPTDDTGANLGPND